MSTEKPLGLILKQLHDEMERTNNAMLSQIGLTSSQMRVLFFLFQQAPQPVNQRQLQEHLGVSHPTVVGLLSRLEQKGLVACQKDIRDLRCKRFVLTEQFEALRQDMLAQRQSMDAQLTRGLTAEQVRLLKECLGRIYDNITQPS